MFRQTGINAVYLPFRVPRGELAESVQAFDAVPVSGYSVTIPHKEAAAALAVAADDRVGETGAANTLVQRPDGFHAVQHRLRGGPRRAAAEHAGRGRRAQGDQDESAA